MATITLGHFKKLIFLRHKIAELLESEMPQIKTAIGLSKVYGISFMHEPKGIYISRGYKPKEFELINRNHKTCFNLTGISVWNKKENLFQPIKLYYQSRNCNGPLRTFHETP